MKFSVLTYVFGNYEILHEPHDTHRNVEYVCVTDNPNLKSQHWKIIYDPINADYTPFRKVVEVRYNPFKYVSNEICLIVDGSIQIQNIPWKLIDKFTQDHYDIATLVHPSRDNLITEIDAWKTIRNLPDLDISLCKSWLSNINYNTSYLGLFQTGIILVRNIDYIVDFLHKVLNINNSCSEKNSTFRVDQILFSAILNKYYYNKLKCLHLSSTELFGHYFKLYQHNTYNTETTPLNYYLTTNYNKQVFNTPTTIVPIFKLNRNIVNRDMFTICICNFNTTELTNNTIKSIITNIPKNYKYKIIVLDNSDTDKFKINDEISKYNIKVIDNTNQKYIKFNDYLNSFPLFGPSKKNNYASLKHSISIQFLLDICQTKYMMLCDSDIIVKKSLQPILENMMNSNSISSADIEYTGQASENINTNLGKSRFTPFIQLFNIELMMNMNIRYFDIRRIHGVSYGNLYDTGASFYEDIITNKIGFIQLHNTEIINHLGHGSWNVI